MTCATRLSLVSLCLACLAGPAAAQTPATPTPAPGSSAVPEVTFGVQSFLQYAAELHETNKYNAFDVTRGYFNVNAKFSDRLRARFTTDIKPTTDASLNSNLAARLEYAYLEAGVTDRTIVKFGMQETPWLAFEESINRYRAQGTFFAERTGLIPGPADLGASLKTTTGSTEVQVGVYNGEGYGHAELDKYKSLQGRATFRPYYDEAEHVAVRLTGFYSYGWYAKDRPRNVALVMGSYESPKVVATAQYLNATDNPFVARDIERRGLSFFGEGRQGVTGWAGIGRVDIFDPDATRANDTRRRYIFGGAHWSQAGRGRVGVIVTLEQLFQVSNSQKLESRLLAQTHVEF